MQYFSDELGKFHVGKPQAAEMFQPMRHQDSSSRGHTVGASCTPWTINMEPKNGGLEDDFPFQLGDL